MPHPTSAVYIFTRDRLRGVGCESTVAEDAWGMLRTWVAVQGRSADMVAETPDRLVALLRWAGRADTRAASDFRRHCEIFALGWLPARGPGTLG